MSDNQTLEVAPSVTQEPSAPVEEVKVTTEEGETTEPESKGEEEKPKPELTEAEKKAHALEKRVARQTAANKAQMERIRHLEEQMQAYEAQKPKVDDAPKQENFDTYEEWEQATIEHVAKKRAEEIIQSERQKELQAAQERKAMETRKQFEAKENAFRTQTADYDLVAGEAVSVMNELASAGQNIIPLRDAVMQFDNPPALIYQLGREPELIQELVGMEPLKAMRELVKLEMTIDHKPKTEAKPLPEPIKPVNPNGRTRKRLDEMTYEEREKYFASK